MEDIIPGAEVIIRKGATVWAHHDAEDRFFKLRGRNLPFLCKNLAGSWRVESRPGNVIYTEDVDFDDVVRIAKPGLDPAPWYVRASDLGVMNPNAFADGSDRPHLWWKWLGDCCFNLLPWESLDEEECLAEIGYCSDRITLRRPRRDDFDDIPVHKREFLGEVMQKLRMKLRARRLPFERPSCYYFGVRYYDTTYLDFTKGVV